MKVLYSNQIFEIDILQTLHASAVGLSECVSTITPYFLLLSTKLEHKLLQEGQIWYSELIWDAVGNFLQKSDS